MPDGVMVQLQLVASSSVSASRVAAVCMPHGTVPLQV